MNSNNEEIKDSKVALVAHIFAALIYLGLGICLLTLNTGLISTIVYSFSVLGVGILFIVFGAWYMIKYFFNHEYTKISNYGFTMGVILVIIGALFIFNANLISGFIDGLVCLIGVVLGAIMLQQSFALFHMHRGTWFMSLIFGLLSVGSSIFLMLKPFKFFDGNLYGCIYMIALGSLALLSLIFMFIGIKTHKSDAEKMYNRYMEEGPSYSAGASVDSMFEDDIVSTPYDSVSNAAGSDSLFED